MISSGENKKLSVQLGKNGRPIVKYDDLKAVRVDSNGDQPKDGFGMGELYQLLSIGCGVLCFVYKAKWAAWLCLILFGSCIINFKFDQMF